MSKKDLKDDLKKMQAKRKKKPLPLDKVVADATRKKRKKIVRVGSVRG